MEENDYEEFEVGPSLYDILGQEFFIISETKKYFRRVVAREKEIEEARAMGKREYQRINSLAKMQKNFDAVFDTLLKRRAEDVLQRLIENGIYEYSSDMLERDFSPEYSDALLPFSEPYMRIINSDASDLKKLSQVSKYLSSDEAQNAIVDFFGNFKASGHALEDRIISRKEPGWSYNFDKKKATTLRENCLKAGNISRDQQREILFQVFEANPLDPQTIKTALDLGLDDSGDLAEFAKQVGITIRNAGPQGNRGPNQINNNTVSGSNQASNDAVKALCNKFLLSHNASLFKCSPKLKAALGIANMDDSDIYLARDDTVLKTGRNGFAITKDGIYCREMGASATHISYEMLGCASKITKKLSGSICADKTVIALSTESAKDLVRLFADIAKAVR